MITKNEAFGFWKKGEKKGLGESRASPAILCASSVELLCLLLRTLLVGALEGREYCLRLIDMRARLVLALSLLCNQINVTMAGHVVVETNIDDSSFAPTRT